MKGIVLFICILLCGVDFAFAEKLEAQVCTEGNVQHTIQGDSNDHTIIYIDDEVYNFKKQKTIGDIDLTEYSKDNDPEMLAFISVEVYEDAEGQDVKLVLMRHNSGIAEFGGMCEIKG